VSIDESRARRYARAPIFMRFIAHVIDLVIVVVPVFVGVVVFITLEMNDHQVVGRSIALAIFLAVLYYTFAKDGRPGGQSFGKRAAKLMVVNVSTNQPCTARESAIRSLLLLALGLVPVLGWFIEPIALLVDEHGRRLGDKAAGTQVIEVEQYTS